MKKKLKSTYKKKKIIQTTPENELHSLQPYKEKIMHTSDPSNLCAPLLIHQPTTITTTTTTYIQKHTRLHVCAKA